MSAIQSAAGKVQPAETPPRDVPAQSAQRARSVPVALPLAPATRPDGDIQSRARALVARLLAPFAIPKGTDVLRASGLHAAHVRHKEAAASWGTFAWMRHVWGYLHLPFKGFLGVIDWVTESPARFIVAAVIVAACVLWH